ncbi:MAG: hypothetical protein IAE82_19090 [Opitutaceae bacterium]|nr:hypothetical protein [Opitutaceae bacterium]
MQTRPHALSATLIACCLGLLVLSGCGGGAHKDDHEHDDHEHGHSHEPRHGGVAVVLGDEAYHVEFTHGDVPGTLRAYFFDGHMENYIRISAPSFAGTGTVAGETRPLTFSPVSDAATGETAGDTALFEARADWLSGAPAVELRVPRLDVRGTTFTDIAASLPARAHP